MSWIWIDEKTHPNIQKNFYNIDALPQREKDKFNYAVVSFEKSFHFESEIKSIKFKISADSSYHLFINGCLTNIGPASPGGDFLCTREYTNHFADVFSVAASGRDLSVRAEVKLLPEVFPDFSSGQGGFFCDMEVTDINGIRHSFATDGSWDTQHLTAYCKPLCFDSRTADGKTEKAVVLQDRWHLRESEIPPVTLNTVFEKEYIIPSGKEDVFAVDIDKIYGIIPHIVSDGTATVTLTTRELKGQPTQTESIVFGKAGEYTSFRMHSMGEALLSVRNDDTKDIKLSVRFIAPYYPVTAEGFFRCSDGELNRVFEVCKHTLKICRQSIHLDSTKHQELLACTGDYNIEALMTLFCFGDMSLAVSDVKKTADWLKFNGGKMYHTTYSLIWVRMLKNVYTATGDKSMLEYCEHSLKVLLSLFDTYFGDSGVIENPPDYIFVDWTVIDGYTMHHPPKALGQTVLNAFWYDAVKCAADIYDTLEKYDEATALRKRAEKFKTAFNREFYDAQKGLYFDGKTDKYEPNDGLPENSDKIYYSKYPNILASAFGLAENPVLLLERIITDDSMQDIQPYFAHYLLIAIKEAGLTDKYAMGIFNRWKAVVAECDKGLSEGWIQPQPDYQFDHSHAWGGAVAYHLPAMVSGFEILEPGMKKLAFSPKLLGLDFADITIETPYGTVFLSISGDNITLNAPEEIEVILKQSPVH